MELPPFEFSFINQPGASSSSATPESIAAEKSRVLSYVQQKRRQRESKKEVQAWAKYSSVIATTSTSAEDDGEQLAKPTSNSQSASTLIVQHRPKRNTTAAPSRTSPPASLPRRYPTSNVSDPFHCTVAGERLTDHAILRYASATPRMTFLAEAFAPAGVANGARAAGMRHDVVISERLRRCVDEPDTMYSTLAYASSCLAWAEGRLDTDRPPEYWLGLALGAVRERVKGIQSGGGGLGEDEGGKQVGRRRRRGRQGAASKGDRGGDITRRGLDTWALLSVYTLAIIQHWNNVPEFWTKCPEQYVSLLKGRARIERGSSGDTTAGGDDADDADDDDADIFLPPSPSSPSPATTHLNALVGMVERAGGWANFDPYLVESVVLADKYISLRELRRPVLAAGCDPGPVPPPPSASSATAATSPQPLAQPPPPLFFPHLGSALLSSSPAPSYSASLRAAVADLVDYVRLAHALWLDPAAVDGELESWLFFRLQALTCRLLALEWEEEGEEKEEEEEGGVVEGRPKSPSPSPHFTTTTTTTGRDRCARLAALVFVQNVNEYHGAQVAARALAARLRQAVVAEWGEMIERGAWMATDAVGRGAEEKEVVDDDEDDDEDDSRLLFWCLCTGAMLNEASPTRDWCVAALRKCCRGGPPSLHECRGRLAPYLFLATRQDKQLAAVVAALN